jgi:hypothetical protein
MEAHGSPAEIVCPDAEDVHKLKMQEVGRLIVGDPPPWLRDLLSDFSFNVHSANSIETIWPTRTQMRTFLTKAETSAIELSKVLTNHAMAGFLASNSDVGSEDFIMGFISSLEKLVSSVRQARNSPQLVGDDRKLLLGRGKPFLPGDMPGKYVCAAIIAEVWAFFNEKDPAPSNHRAWEAADNLWHSWVPPKRWGNDPLTKWKRYFESVRNPKLEPLRSEVLRYMKIHAHVAAVMLEK